MVSSAQTPSTRASLPLLTPVGRFGHLNPLEVRDPICLIGSRFTVDLRLRSSLVEGLHAVLISDASGVVIRDLSGGRSFVNEKPVAQQRLDSGDRVRLGPLECRFSCPAPAPSSSALAPALSLRVRGKAVAWESRSLLIGRAEEADLRLVGGGISRIHVVLARVGGRILLRDPGSRAGTSLNGAPVRMSPIVPGDVIEIAGIPIHCELPSAQAGAALGLSNQNVDLPPAARPTPPRRPMAGVSATPDAWGPLGLAICHDERLRPVPGAHRHRHRGLRALLSGYFSRV